MGWVSMLVEEMVCKLVMVSATLNLETVLAVLQRILGERVWGKLGLFSIWWLTSGLVWEATETWCRSLSSCSNFRSLIFNCFA